MAFCGTCGTKVDEGINFCPSCGNAMTANAATQQQTAGQEQAAPKAVFDAKDIESNKVMAALGYILFLIPLLAAKESPYAKFHANQGLLLLIAGVIVGVVGSIIPILGWFLILPFGSLIVGIFGILGIINAITGKAKELPLIGKISIIK